MKKDSPDIEKLKRENIYQLPDRYFDELTLRIQTKVNQEKEPISSWYNSPQVSWSLAASTLVLILGVWIFYPADSDISDPLATFSSAEIADYLAYEEVSVYDIADHTDISSLIDELDHDYMDVVDEMELEGLYSEYDFNVDIL